MSEGEEIHLKITILKTEDGYSSKMVFPENLTRKQVGLLCGIAVEWMKHETGQEVNPCVEWQLSDNEPVTQ